METLNVKLLDRCRQVWQCYPGLPRIAMFGLVGQGIIVRSKIKNKLILDETKVFFLCQFNANNFKS